MRYVDGPRLEVPDRDWNGCKLVNPLCPDDLCWLPLAPGRKYHREHCLGTDRWDERSTLADMPAMYLSKTATTREELIFEGWCAQLRRFPDEAEFRRLTNPDLYYACFAEIRRPNWPTWPARQPDAQRPRP